jgi:hypothetical protein
MTGHTKTSGWKRHRRTQGEYETPAAYFAAVWTISRSSPVR